MPIDPVELCGTLSPHRTNLFLGAGASIPSGAPSALELAKMLCNELAKGEQISDDLTEAASILTMRFGRGPVVAVVRNALQHLAPTGGLLALPTFDWASIFTTNFDRLLETAYRRHEKPLNPIRSNYDWGRSENSEGITLYKIHGCISQDIVDGHKTGMTLTEDDYESAEKYREAIFRRLEIDLTVKDVLVIGYSLADRHLRHIMNEAVRVQSDAGGIGRLFALIYNPDLNRAQLLENKGFRIAFGGIDQFVHALTDAKPPPAEQLVLTLPFSVTPAAMSSTTHVGHAITLQPNVTKLFNGSPATFPDIRDGFTFPRTLETMASQSIADGRRFVCAIIGVAGVGKITLARRLLYLLVEYGFECWEHNNDFPFRSGEWIRIEASLRAEGKRGAILIDDALEFQRQMNIIVDAFAKIPNPALAVILTPPRSQWEVRVKSPEIFKRGTIFDMTELDLSEINELVNLLDRRSEIRALVDRNFARLSRADKVDHLRRRCSADMYVCLNNIFAFETLDEILLREYAELNGPQQEVYRHVAALEAAGARVHRQLIVRVLGIKAEAILTLLNEFLGLVDEYDIQPQDGIYGWQTRHLVIAGTIANYKYSDQTELYNLFRRVIENSNPTIRLELKTLSQICNLEFGIGRIKRWQDQIDLLRLIVELAPGERVPRHRIISTYLYNDQLDQAEQAVRDALSAVKLDPPINRYRIRLAIARAEKTEGILEEDRIAMLHRAESIAAEGLRRFGHDKFTYIEYARVGEKIAERTNDVNILDQAIERLREGAELIADPEMDAQLRSFERVRRRWARDDI